MSDQELYRSLLGEIDHMEEILAVFEEESISLEEALGLIGGIQRDVAHLSRAAQA